LICVATNFYIKRKRDHVKSQKKGDLSRYKRLTTGELIVFFGCILALCFGSMSSRAAEWGTPSFDDLERPLGLGQWSGMSLNRFNVISEHLTVTQAPLTEDEKNDPYFDYRPLVNGFNDHWEHHFYPGHGVCIDETVFHWYGQGLPHVSYLPRKPKGLGTEVKTLCDYMCGVLFRMELQESKGAMGKLLKVAKEKFGSSITKTTACVMRLTEKLHDQTGAFGRQRVVIGDSWFAGVATAVALRAKQLYFVGPVKTNKKDFPFDELNRAVGEERGSSASMHATISGVALLAVGWRRRKAYKKRGKWVTGIYHMISTCSLPSPGPAAKFKRHSKDGKRVRDYVVERPLVFHLYHAIMPMVDQHNARRQGYLGLERAFGTRSAWMRFFCSWFGVIVINAFLLCKYFAAPTNPLKNMPQKEWVKKLAMEMMAYEKTTAAAEASVPEAAAEKQLPFDFIKSPRQQRCKTPNCKGKTELVCANCVGADKNKDAVSSYAFCATFFERKQAESGSKKRGCMALHAASCPNSKHTKPDAESTHRRHSTGNM